MKKEMIGIFFLLVLVGSVSSADLHVGDGQPYSSIASAISAGSPGDIIHIHEGTYFENDLTPKSGMTLKGVDGENLPIINAQQTTFNHNWNNNPISIEHNDITLYRLDIRDGATGSVIIEDSGISNIEISNCRLIRTAMSATTDNAALLYVKPGVRNLSVHHNYFESACSGFHGAIYFNPDGATSPFYNNELRINANAHGYFIKHAGNSDGRLQIYNNFIVMNRISGDNAMGIFVSHDNVDIRNNLIIGNGGAGVKIALDAGGCGGSGTILDHNTIYMDTAVRGSFHIDNDCGETDITFRNNILRRTSTSTEFRNVNAWIYGSTHTWSGHHNLVFQNAVGTVLYATPSGTYTMSQWKYTGQGIGSYDNDAIFVDLSGNLNQVSDFALASNSPGYRAASDGTDMGANVSLVGTNIQYTPSTEYCGDGECNNGETCTTCSADCGACSCTEYWSCSEWSSCVNNIQTRTCNDLNDCGTTDNRPALTSGCTVSTTPTVGSVSGNLIHGENVTIIGSGFGTKPQANPRLWDDFEDQESNQAVRGTSPVIGSSWVTHQVGTDDPTYSNSVVRPGSDISVKLPFKYGGWANSLQHLYDLPAGGSCYFTFWWYYTSPDDNTDNMKPFYIYDQDFDDPNVGVDTALGTSNTGGGFRQGVDGPGTTWTIWGGQGSRTISQLKNYWIRYEVYIAPGTPGQSNGVSSVYAQYQDSSPAIYNIINGNGQFYWGSDYYRYFFIGEFDQSNPGHSSTIYLDDIYFDNTLARIEIGDKSTWSACTKREIQVPQQWSDGSITFTVNQGSFHDGDSAYIFVVDENGDVSSGKAITFSGSYTGPCHDADTNADGQLSVLEISAYINRWKNGQVSMSDLIDAIKMWKAQ